MRVGGLERAADYLLELVREMLLEWTVPWLILFSCNAKSKVSLGVTNTLWTAPWRADGYVQFCFLSLLGNSMKLAYLVLGAMTLLLLGGRDSALSTSRGSLHTFVGCAVREFTFLAKKPGCSGLRITTDACWGRCETWEVSSTTGLDGSGLRASFLSLSVHCFMTEGELACLPCALNQLHYCWFFQMIRKS